MELKPIEQQPSRFRDPDDPGEPMRIVLRHSDDDASVECWYMERRIAYDDRRLGLITVPRDRSRFTTDLTSVPDLFTWLVPRTGSHLAAALIHDGLTPPFSEPPRPDWEPEGLAVTRLQADRVFRDAMADLGTPTIRRWLVWSAVTLPSAWATFRWRALVGYLGLAAIVVLGWFATLDLFDQGDWLPWMAGRPWWLELILGGAMAVVIPLLLALLWPSGTRKAGAITGVALAALLHVTVMVGAVAFGYQVLEHGYHVWTGKRWWLKILLTLLGGGLLLLTYWMFRRYKS